jgi:hypothetical protein
MKKGLKKVTPFPSSFHMSNEGGEKKTLTCTPLPLKSKRNFLKIKAHPLPFNKLKKTIQLAPFNSKK